MKFLGWCKISLSLYLSFKYTNNDLTPPMNSSWTCNILNFICNILAEISLFHGLRRIPYLLDNIYYLYLFHLMLWQINQSTQKLYAVHCCAVLMETIEVTLNYPFSQYIQFRIQTYVVRKFCEFGLLTNLNQVIIDLVRVRNFTQ